MKVEIKFKVDVPDVGATEQEIEDALGGELPLEPDLVGQAKEAA